MTHKTYFQNFFAALSDEEFLAFTETVLANLERDAAAHKDDIAYLMPRLADLRTEHRQRGEQGQLHFIG